MKQTKLKTLIQDIESQDFATSHGINVHAQLSKIVYQNNQFIGNQNIISRITSNQELSEIMGSLSRAEVPVAGYVNGVFLSRRIDRLYVNPNTKTVIILDYKTDTNKETNYEKYRAQLSEYYKLVKQIYPDFNVMCKILWTNDFTLENII